MNVRVNVQRSESLQSDSIGPKNKENFINLMKKYKRLTPHSDDSWLTADLFVFAKFFFCLKSGSIAKFWCHCWQKKIDFRVCFIVTHIRTSLIVIPEWMKSQICVNLIFYTLKSSQFSNQSFHDKLFCFFRKRATLVPHNSRPSTP